MLYPFGGNRFLIQTGYTRSGVLDYLFQLTFKVNDIIECNEMPIIQTGDRTPLQYLMLVDTSLTLIPCNQYYIPQKDIPLPGRGMY
jgi:hypothetical protein